MDASLTVVLIAAIVAGLYMAWAIGANDVANSMGTSVGSGAITVGGAILIAGAFEFLGAFLAGGEVTSTIRKGIIDVEALKHDPDLLVIGMLSALLAAAAWLTVASRFGWPVSTTHSIVGAIIGFAVVAIGFDAVHWWDVMTIAASWVVTPVLAGAISYLLVLSVQWLIFNKDDPVLYARRYVPVYIFAAMLVTSVVTFVKGLKHVGMELSMPMAVLYSVLAAGIVAVASRLLINRLSFRSLKSPTAGQSRFTDVEKVFGVLMIVTASGMAFAHGSNDVANAIGPVAAIVGVLTTGEVASKSAVPVWVSVARRRGHRDRPGDVRLPGHGDDREEDHRTHPEPRICRRVCRCVDSRRGKRHGTARFDDPDARGRRYWGRSRPRDGRPRFKGRPHDLRVLDRDASRRSGARGGVLLPLVAGIRSRRRTMRLAEEFLLLLRDKDGALSRAPEWLVRYALGGAVLMDLAMENRIDTDAQRLLLIDSTPVGDHLLDPMLAEIAQADLAHDALYWVEHATRHADEIRETALARLVENGILEVSDDRFLRIFGTRHYSLANDEVVRELIRRIKAVLLTDTIPDPRDIVIVTLADGCGLFGHILSADELAAAAARIELVRQLELIGRVFLNALDVAVQPAAGKLDR